MSDEEEAREQLQDSNRGRQSRDDEWEACEILTDPRDQQGITRRPGTLTRALIDEEEPYLGLFLRFFPLSTFEQRFADVANHYRTNRATRHNVPFNRGVFLRFLGLLLRMVTSPLPNMAWHWDWPSHLPAGM